MGLIQLLFQDPMVFFMLAFVLLYSVILHEVAHGAAALAFGDKTARDAGRLTLNPVSHIDPVGALALLLVGFGWAKPVPVSTYFIRPQRLGVILVALAGPAMNILIAVAAILAFRLAAGAADPTFYTFLLITARINILLAAFNLIPLPPLDGSRLVTEFLPFEMKRRLPSMEKAGIAVLFVLILTGLINPAIDFLQNAISGLLGLIV